MSKITTKVYTVMADEVEVHSTNQITPANSGDSQSNSSDSLQNIPSAIPTLHVKTRAKKSVTLPKESSLPIDSSNQVDVTVHPLRSNPIKKAMSKINGHKRNKHGGSAVNNFPDQDIASSDYHLRCRKLSYTIKMDKTTILDKLKFWQDGEEKKLLDDVYCTFPQNQLCAIIGPSGAGKTTLLNVICGRTDMKKVKGKLTVHDEPISNRNRQGMRSLCGYVAQDDLLMATLTVRENIMFSANMRLPDKTTEESKLKKVNQLIKELGLTKCAENQIGNELIRGVSGGERKRTAIAMELVTDPKLLFLDEPTTGLDASTALEVIKVCKRLSEKQTIIMSIHQPRSTIWKLYDWVVIVDKPGTVIYQGGPDSLIERLEMIGYPCDEYENPPDHVMDVISKPETGFAAHDRLSELHRNDLLTPQTAKKRGRKFQSMAHAHKRTTTLFQINLAVVKGDLPGSYSKFRTLAGRSCKDYIRNPQSLASNIGVQAFISLLFGLLYLSTDGSWGLDTMEEQQNRIGILFLFCICVWQTAVISADIFFKQNALFLREVQAGYYTAGPYFVSKFICELIPNRVIPLIFYATITYWMSGLWKSFNTWLLWLLPIVNIGFASGSVLMLYCSLIPDFRAAVQSYILTTVFSFIVLGVAPNLAGLTPALRWIQWVSIPRYVFVNNLIAEFTSLPDSANMTTAERNELIASSDFLSIDDFSMNGYWRNIGIVWVMTLLIIVSTYVGLRLKTRYL